MRMIKHAVISTSSFAAFLSCPDPIFSRGAFIFASFRFTLCGLYWSISPFIPCVQAQRVPTVKNGFKQGMKLEGIDPQHPSMYFVLTVAEVSQTSINTVDGSWTAFCARRSSAWCCLVRPAFISPTCHVTIQVCGYRLRLHFDGYSDCHDFWVNANSPDIHPPGWCESTGHKLHTPKGQRWQRSLLRV